MKFLTHIFRPQEMWLIQMGFTGTSELCPLVTNKFWCLYIQITFTLTSGEVQGPFVE